LGAGRITIHVGSATVVIYGIGTDIGRPLVGNIRHQLARIDARTQLALDRQDRLYLMVEHVYSLHVPDDTAETITDGGPAEAPQSGQVQVSS
jgi:hypothetical protein